MKKIFNYIAALMLLVGLVGPSMLHAAGNYSITGNATVNGSLVNLSGTVSATPFVGQFGNHFISIDCGSNGSWEHTLLVSSFGIQETGQGNNKSFAGTWSVNNACQVSDGNSITVKVHHGSIGGAESSESGTDIVILGCTDDSFDNYNPDATDDDGSCANEPVLGCTDPDYDNYNAVATQDDGSCANDPILGCTDDSFDNYNPAATQDDGSCTNDPILGCTDDSFDNYNPAATQDDGSCANDPILGCTDDSFDNYNPAATDDDGSCANEPLTDEEQCELDGGTRDSDTNECIMPLTDEEQCELDGGTRDGDSCETEPTDPTPPTPPSGGGGGGGGGGGAGLTIDFCPGGDFSPSFYDGDCGIAPLAGDTSLPAELLQTGNPSIGGVADAATPTTYNNVDGVILPKTLLTTGATTQTTMLYILLAVMMMTMMASTIALVRKD